MSGRAFGAKQCVCIVTSVYVRLFELRFMEMGVGLVELMRRMVKTLLERMRLRTCAVQYMSAVHLMMVNLVGDCG